MKVDARAFIGLAYTCPFCQSNQCIHDVKNCFGTVLTIRCCECQELFDVFILVMQLDCMMYMKTVKKEQDHVNGS